MLISFCSRNQRATWDFSQICGDHSNAQTTYYSQRQRPWGASRRHARSLLKTPPRPSSPLKAQLCRCQAWLNYLVFVLYAGLLAGAKRRRQKISGDVRLKMVKMQTDIAMEDKKIWPRAKGAFLLI